MTDDPRCCERCDSGTVTQKVECTGRTFEVTDSNACTNGGLNGRGTLLIMSAGLINHCTLNMPSDSLMTTVGLWIQDNLPGNVSLVLGAIEMFFNLSLISSNGPNKCNSPVICNMAGGLYIAPKGYLHLAYQGSHAARKFYITDQQAHVRKKASSPFCGHLM
jgi:hypothetical protein